MKAVSVIIAAYRAEDFILEAVNSVLSQQVPDDYYLELIVGVDGCDITSRVLANISHECLRVFNMDGNFGTYVTFNTMIRFATGDLIVRFDADDVMLEGYLAKQISVFETEPKVYLTWTRNRYIDAKGQFMSEMDLNYEEHLEFWQIRSPSNGQFMMRRQLWDALGAFQPWRCSGDTDFLIRMRFLGLEERGLEEILYHRRIHPDSLTQSDETGYDSQLRSVTKAKMYNAAESRTSAEECLVTPVVGGIKEAMPKEK